MDLAVANGSAGTASIFPGTATGFGTRIDYFGIAAHPVATVTGDVDGDGQSDLIVAGGDSSFLAILRSGAGTTTATMLERFDASPVANAVELVWDVGDPSQVASVTIERALDSNGPWRPVAAEPRNDGDAMRALDRDVEPATTYFYRLVMAFVDGGHYVSSAVSVQTRGDDAVSGIIALEPNPVRDAPTIRYAIARAGRVRLDVTDVAGRVVATLVDAFESGGGHTATWHASGRTAAGVYFVRLRAPGGSNTVRRFAIVP
jgi:hypothetical protein